MTRTYIELIKFPTFEERLTYLMLEGKVGDETFGFDRFINQRLYTSHEWQSFRRRVIVRDNGNDLASDGHEIFGKILIHHINPITLDDIVNRNACIFDLNNVVCTSLDTHNLIHYGYVHELPQPYAERSINDTSPWKKVTSL